MCASAQHTISPWPEECISGMSAMAGFATTELLSDLSFPWRVPTVGAIYIQDSSRRCAIMILNRRYPIASIWHDIRNVGDASTILMMGIGRTISLLLIRP